MGAGGGLMAVALAGALLFAVLPLAEAGCPDRFDVHGRRGALAPMEDPRAALGGAVCVRSPYVAGAEDRVLLPGIDEVAVHLGRDLGPGVPTLPLRLDGLGFANASLLMTRQAEPRGFAYALPYTALPAGPATSGALLANVTLPDASTLEVAYRVAP